MFTSSKYHPTANWTQLVLIKNNILRMLAFPSTFDFFFFLSRNLFQGAKPTSLESGGYRAEHPGGPGGRG